MTDNQPGLKFDADKTPYHLMPPDALEAINKVLAFGAKKYGAHNWKSVTEPEARYYSAAMRHMQAWLKGEHSDIESGLPHLAHAACCLVFLLEREVK